MNKLFNIDTYEGTITTKVDKALDYEIQQQVVINVQVKDCKTCFVEGNTEHTVLTQFTIDVIDVPPRIFIVSFVVLCFLKSLTL